MNQEKKTRGTGSRKTLKIGSLTVTTTAVVLAIFILINLFVSELPTTVTKIDLSSSSLYTVSDESETVIRGIGEDVHFYILTERGNENENVVRLLDRYRDINGRVSYSTVDPADNPLFAEQYTDKTLSDNSVIAVSGRRSYALDASEFAEYVYKETGEVISADEYAYYYQMYTQCVELLSNSQLSEEEQSYYYQMYLSLEQLLGNISQYFMGDAKLAAAADYVTRETIPVLCTLTGHGEEAIDASYAQYMDSQNILTRELNLANTGAVPDDCAAIYIGNPSADISPDELTLLRGFAQRGGSILLVTGAVNYSSAKMPNLTALAADFGMESVDGLVVEGDPNHYNFFYGPHFLMPEYGSSSEEPFDKLKRTYNVTLSMAHGILASGTGSVSPILYTSAKAYVKDTSAPELTLNREDGDLSGVFYLGAVGQSTEGGRLVWFSSPDIANSRMDASGGNSQTFFAFLNWLSDSSHNMLSLPGREYTEAPLTVTAADQGLWAVVLIGVIPLLALAGGFVIWFRRRKK